jgi:hypothetical protein
MPDPASTGTSVIGLDRSSNGAAEPPPGPDPRAVSEFQSQCLCPTTGGSPAEPNSSRPTMATPGFRNAGIIVERAGQSPAGALRDLGTRLGWRRQCAGAGSSRALQMSALQGPGGGQGIPGDAASGKKRPPERQERDQFPLSAECVGCTTWSPDSKASSTPWVKYLTLTKSNRRIRSRAPRASVQPPRGFDRHNRASAR